MVYLGDGVLINKQLYSMNDLYVGFGWIWWNYSISSSYCDGCESIRWVSIGFTLSEKDKKSIPPSQQIVPENVANPNFGKLSSNHLVELCFSRKL